MDTRILKIKICDLALRGKLVQQVSYEESASILLERIREQKKQLAAEGKIKKGKALPKITNDDIPFDIPENWSWCRLGELCELITKGSSPSWQGVKYVDKGILFITSENIGNEKLTLLNSKHLEPIFNQIQNRSILKKGDILTNIVGASIGRSAIFDIEIEDANINQAVALIRPIYLDLNDYLIKVLNSQMIINQMTYNSVETARANISLTTVANLLIPLPPLDEQKRIVETIEKCFAIIDEIEANKKDLGECLSHTKRKVIDLAIHGKMETLDTNDEPAIELLKRIKPKFTPCETSDFDNLPEKWCVCRLEDIVEYEQPNQYLVETENYSNEYTTPVLTAGKTFILGYTNETEGIYSKLPTIIFDDFTTDSRLVDFPFKVKSSAMKILQVNKEINIKYVAYFMSVTRLLGDSHKRQWIEHYAKVPIPIPPRKEQDRIVKKIEEAFGLLDAITAEL